MGLHSAADTEYEWPFYQQLVVAPFSSHPVIQEAAIDLVDPAHPALAGQPSERWIATDEWYDFGRHPRDTPDTHVVATLDETTYQGGLMGADHPIIWTHEALGGRCLYSALGHVATRWQEPRFIDHVVAAIGWVTRR
jgi:type 1 glutamine amidotransferase